jgi:hypothetical protein
MAQCTNHPQYEAIEHCEHCGVSLCGLCLWYAESGERLCQRCAQQWQSTGYVVYEPQRFADGIQTTLAGQGPPTAEHGLYSGNSVDLGGLAAACFGAMMLLSCVPCLNVLAPILGLLVGLMALAQAQHAINPKRTRILAWIGIGGGSAVMLLGIGWLALSFGLPFMILLVEAISNINP